MSLKKVLENYSKSNMYPFHMPGHKRQLEGCYKIDMTEVEGVDDLHDPTEVILEEQERLSRLYKSDSSFILVGGSTVGNLAGIYASCNEKDTILIQRNSHRSVYNAAMLRHLKVEYIYPTVMENGIFNAVTLDQIKSAKEKCENKVSAVVITSPTYEGFHCRIKEIADYCKSQEIILIVDQAHGAHLGFEKSFMESAVGYADITIQSLHKTLPCLTQTAALHLSGNRVDALKVRQALDIFETSSPSYVLMNSVSNCLDILENNGELFAEYVDNLKDFYEVCGELKRLKVIELSYSQKDPGKLVISTENTNITGVMLAKILREKYQLETELSSFAYLLAMTSIMDKKEGFERLKKALIEIDKNLEDGKINVPSQEIIPIKELEFFEAKNKPTKLIELKEAKGRVASAMVCLYPPGSPVIVPGEKITEQCLSIINEAMEKGIHVTGLDKGFISVVN